MAGEPVEVEEGTRPAEVEGLAVEDRRARLAAMQEGVRALIQRGAEAERALAEGQRRQEDELRRLLLEVVEVSDAFERLFATADEMGDRVDAATRRWLRNFQTVHRLLQRLLQRHGVAEVETLDGMFDPVWHTVAEVVSDPERPDGTIVKVLRKGYGWRNQVLRPAEIIAVRNED